MLLLVHGLGEHSGRYEGMGAWFARRSCAVHAYDLQGHGRSSGKRGHARRFRHFVDDLEVVLSTVAQEHPGPPIFLFGHSMGGLVVEELLRGNKPDIAGAVTSGAVLAADPSQSSMRAFVLRALRHLLPRWSIETGIDPEALCSDSAVGRQYLEDPLVLRHMTLSLAAEFSATRKLAESGAPEIELPMLLLQGEEDGISPIEGSRAFRAGLATPSELRTYPGLRHEIWNEPLREAIFEEVLDWLCRRERIAAHAS